MAWWQRRRPSSESCPACGHSWVTHAGSEADEIPSPDRDACRECSGELAAGSRVDPQQLCRSRAHHSRVQVLLAAVHDQLAEDGPVSWVPPIPRWSTARVEFHLDDGRTVALWEDDDTLRVVVDHTSDFLVADEDEHRFRDDARTAVMALLTPPGSGAPQAGDRLRQLWDDHRTAAFPARLRGGVAGIDVVQLDADIAGHVDSWSEGGERLSAGTAAALRELSATTDEMVPHLASPAERDYVRRLREMAELLLIAHR